MMATTIFMASDHPSENFNGVQVQETVPETGKQSGRRKSKSNEQNQKKKQPQRGMGVAQLEKLRISERWKKMTVINSPPPQPQAPQAYPLHSYSFHQHQQQFISSSLADPAVPAQLAFGSYGAPPVMNSAGQSTASLVKPFLLQRIGNDGHVPVGCSGFVGVPTSSTPMSLSYDQFQVDSYGVGGQSSGLSLGITIGTSKELSSMPNTNCYSEKCGVCHKQKKRINEEKIRCNTVGGMQLSDMAPQINGPSFLGLNFWGNLSSLDGENHGKEVIYTGPANTDQDEMVEVLAVHRTGSVGRTPGVVVEYDFFPEKNGELHSESFSVGAVDASTAVDLSLKLFY